MDNNQDKKNKNEERHAMWLELFYDIFCSNNFKTISLFIA